MGRAGLNMAWAWLVIVIGLATHVLGRPWACLDMNCACQDMASLDMGWAVHRLRRTWAWPDLFRNGHVMCRPRSGPDIDLAGQGRCRP
jgi:hypothetical protein